MKPQPRIPTFNTPMRQCANPKCKRLYDPRLHDFTTCSWKCHQVVQAELAAIDEQDKQESEMPF